MITGVVTADFEAISRLTLRGPNRARWNATSFRHVRNFRGMLLHGLDSIKIRARRRS